MHITFRFSLGQTSSIRLPTANLHLFQSMLYSILPDDEAEKLHDEDKMKLFAMSWPIANSRPQFGEDTIIFPLPLKLVVSTPLQNLTAGFVMGALNKNLRIGNNYLTCLRVETEQQQVSSSKITVKTLSPITFYNSVIKDDKPYRIYFNPYNSEFQQGIHKNLLKKFHALYPEKDLPKDEFKIIPIGELKERISMYEKESSFPIKGWWGRFRLEGNPELLQIALDCGLGSKNSGGWGCITQNFKRRK